MFEIKILVTGGCKNGKSFYAEQLLNKLGLDFEKYYIATMKPCDDEDLERIQRHRKDRQDYGFITIEQALNIKDCIHNFNDNSSILLDSTTALLSNEMFLQDGEINYKAHEKISDELISLSKNVKNIIFVSDYIYSDAQIYDELTEKYRFSLAYIDKNIAKECDVVCEVSFGNKIFHKGAEII